MRRRMRTWRRPLENLAILSTVDASTMSLDSSDVTSGTGSQRKSLYAKRKGMTHRDIACRSQGSLCDRVIQVVCRAVSRIIQVTKINTTGTLPLQVATTMLTSTTWGAPLSLMISAKCANKCKQWTFSVSLSLQIWTEITVKAKVIMRTQTFDPVRNKTLTNRYRTKI